MLKKPVVPCWSILLICACSSQMGCSDSKDRPSSDADIDADAGGRLDGGGPDDSGSGDDVDTDTQDGNPRDAGTGTDSELQGVGLELDNGVVHLALDENAGGSIRHISQSGSAYNVVNVADQGRYIQQSYYAGQSLDRIKDGQHPAWSPWAWNPIQAGDAFGNKTIILDSYNTGTEIYVKTLPMLWDMDDEYAECEFETWVSLEGIVVHVRNRVTIHRTDDLWTEVRPQHQELPAVYTIGDLTNLYTYTGDAPWTSGALTEVENSGPPWQYWNTKEHWAAFVNDSDWGLGVYNERCTRFVGGFHGEPGGGFIDGATGYISPLATESFGPTAVYEYDYDLILGNLSDIRSYVYSLNR